MLWRFIWGLVACILFLSTPWWVVLIWCAVGGIFFSWYLEMVFWGIFYDVMFGGVAIPWYSHLMHTGIFAGGLLVVEFCKKRINI